MRRQRSLARHRLTCTPLQGSLTPQTGCEMMLAPWPERRFPPRSCQPAPRSNNFHRKSESSGLLLPSLPQKTLMEFLVEPSKLQAVINRGISVNFADEAR